MTPLANVTLMTDKIGNTIVVKDVTPSELLLLVADNKGIGRDPVLKLEILPEKNDTAKLKEAHDRLSYFEQKIDELDNLTTDEAKALQYEVLIARRQTFEQQADRWRLNIEMFNNRKAMRELDPVAERARLAAKYGKKRVFSVFTGAVPTLPADFESAKLAGYTAEMESQTLLVATPN